MKALWDWFGYVVFVVWVIGGAVMIEKADGAQEGVIIAFVMVSCFQYFNSMNIGIIKNKTDSDK